MSATAASAVANASDGATGPAPVDRRVTVQLPPDEAFALFTQQLRDWWPLTSYSCSNSAAAQVTFEPRIGGAVTELAPDGGRHPWGTLTEWNPPHGFAMSWHPGQPPDEATRVRITFAAVSDGATEVRVLHEGWQAGGAHAQEMRDGYDAGWPRVLSALAGVAAVRRVA